MIVPSPLVTELVTLLLVLYLNVSAYWNLTSLIGSGTPSDAGVNVTYSVWGKAKRSEPSYPYGFRT